MTASSAPVPRFTGAAKQWSPAWQRYCTAPPSRTARSCASPQSGWQRCACAGEDWNAWQMELLLATAKAGGWRPSTSRSARPDAEASPSCTSAHPCGSTAEVLLWAAPTGGGVVLSISCRGTIYRLAMRAEGGSTALAGWPVGSRLNLRESGSTERRHHPPTAVYLPARQ